MAQLVTVPLCPAPGAWIVGTGPMAGVLNCRDPSTLVAVTPIPVDGVLLSQSEYDSLTSSASWFQSNQAALINVLNNQSTLAAQSFDPATAGQFYVWGFVGVFLVAFAAWGAGEILGFIKHVLEIRS